MILLHIIYSYICRMQKKPLISLVTHICIANPSITLTPDGEIILWWRHNGRDSDSNHQPHGCLLNRLFKSRSRKTSKLQNSPHKWPVTRKMFPFEDVIMWKIVPDLKHIQATPNLEWVASNVFGSECRVVWKYLRYLPGFICKFERTFLILKLFHQPSVIQIVGV